MDSVNDNERLVLSLMSFIGEGYITISLND
jgi:hypothetical protein